MKPFRYCPACGTELDSPDPDGGGRCPNCERSWYRNSSPTVGAAIVHDGRALATVRGREPEKGRLDVPGGFLGPGEHPLDGLRREVKEELDVDVDATVEDCISMAIHRYGSEGDFVLALGFRATVSGGPAMAELTGSDDVAEVRWVSAQELEDLDFAWPHDRELLRKALTDGRS